MQKNKFTCELSARGIDGSPSVMGQVNNDDVPYGE
jgi:hypothetical protein